MSKAKSHPTIDIEGILLWSPSARSIIRLKDAIVQSSKCSPEGEVSIFGTE